MYSIPSAIVVVQMAFMGLLAMSQATTERQIVAGLFIVPILGHDMLFLLLHNIDATWAVAINNSPFAYHFAGALVSWWTVRKLAEFYTPPYLASQLQWVCAISILYELVGWLMYRYAVPDDLLRYNIMYAALYTYAIIALRQGEPRHAGSNTTDDRFFIAPGYVCQRHFSNHSY